MTVVARSFLALTAQAKPSQVPHASQAPRPSDATRLMASGSRNGVKPSSRAALAMRWVTGARSADGNG